MANLRNLNFIPEGKKYILPGEQKTSRDSRVIYGIIAAGAIAALAYSVFGGRGGCTNREEEQNKCLRPAITANSGLEGLTNSSSDFLIVKEDPEINAKISDHYLSAESYFCQGSTNRAEYHKSIDSCTEALALINQSGSQKHLMGDLLFMRGRAKAQIRDFDGAVKDLLDSLASENVYKDNNDDSSVEKQSNQALYQLLSGNDRLIARNFLKRCFKGYDPINQKRILGNLRQTGSENAAYRTLTE
jgi:hypothetical protein